MPDILVVRCNMLLPRERMQSIIDNLKAQKEETGVIIIPPYLEVQVVPDDIEIKFIENGKENNNGWRTV